MKTKPTTTAALLNSSILFGFVLCSLGLLIGLVGLSKSVTGTLAATPNSETQSKHHHYRFINLGTFGGPTSFINPPFNVNPELSSQGVTGGASATSVSVTSTNNPFV